MGMELPSRNSPAEQVRALVLRKDAIEAEIDAQASVLKTNNITMQSPLVDPEGFPRADIDVWEVRHARVRIIELRNDLKDIMDQIMKGLQGVYDPAIVAEASQSETSNPSGMKPFAKVDGVAPGSPAVAAGLLKEDLILSFGSLTQSSFSANSLQPLASLAATHENREVPVQILRGKDEILTLKLLPRKGWGGRGLLGWVFSFLRKALLDAHAVQEDVI